MSFDDRRKDFEARYAHDQEFRFRVIARRNKLLGLWAAERLGRSGADADGYAHEVVAASLAMPGDEALIEKLRGDLSAAGVDEEDTRIRRQLALAMTEAQARLSEE